MEDRYRLAATIKVFLKNLVWVTGTTEACCLADPHSIFEDIFFIYPSLVMTLQTNKPKNSGEANLILIHMYTGTVRVPLSSRELL